MPLDLPGHAFGRLPPLQPSLKELREWWHELLREHGKYKAYAVFLVLPADQEAIYYLQKNEREIDAITGNGCLVIIFTNTRFIRSNLDSRRTWHDSLREYYSEGHSIRLAEIFDIQLQEFPCLILFRDIRSPEHVKVSLKGLETTEITERMRVIFSLIKKATSTEQNPLLAVENYLNNQVLVSGGKMIANKIGGFAGKTLDTVMKAYIEAVMKANI